MLEHTLKNLGTKTVETDVYNHNGDRPLSRMLVWSIPTVLCLEAYVTMSIRPGGESSWTIRYNFYTLDPKN